MTQNEKLLNNMKELDRQKLPKWFNGELYNEGAEVRNRFSGDSCQLNNVELSMYDFVMGSVHLIEMGRYKATDAKLLQKGLDWFRKNNPDAYYILLD
jgi:hypothetical protein